MKNYSGYDQQYRQMAGDVAGLAGTATATAAASLTDSGATFSVNAYAGHMVLAGNSAATFVYGVVISNTATVLTIDRWYTPSSPGGAAASTPSATAPYIIMPGGAPCWYMGLTADSADPALADTTLPSEITTASGGLIRKICTVAHTASATTYTLAATFTANGSDSLPVTVWKVGISPSIKSTATLQLFETALPSSVTFSSSGDATTITDTISM